MRNKVIKYISVVLLASSVAACERVIDLDMPKGEALPYVDAWITDRPGVQTIKFLRSGEYMSSAAPNAISDAQITVTDVTAASRIHLLIKMALILTTLVVLPLVL